MDELLRALLVWCTLAFVGVPAGADEPHRAEELGTKFGDSDNSVARQILENPQKFSLDYPTYLIGVEKALRTKIGAPKLPDLDLDLEEYPTFYLNAVTFSNFPLPGVKSRSERMFVSHLIEFARPVGAAGPYQATVRYSAYDKTNLEKAKNAFSEGKDRLLGMREQIKAAIRSERPTHLIVFSTGWNTTQGGTHERLKNLLDSLANSAEGREFRPLVVAISWPSTSERLGPTLDGVTYNVKSCDADEVGLVWASTLVNQVLVPARDEVAREGAVTAKPGIIAIGHSFGARVVTWPAYCGGLRQPPRGPDADLTGPDFVIGLQGAFSIARFVEGKGVEGAPYSKIPAGTRFVYTSSSHDKAVETFNAFSSPINDALESLSKFLRLPKLERAQFGVPLIGGKTAYDKASEEGYVNVLERLKVADSAGNLDRPIPKGGNKIILVDSSAIIKTKPKDERTAMFSGAHGDVYNVEVARMIWQVLSPKPLRP